MNFPHDRVSPAGRFPGSPYSARTSLLLFLLCLVLLAGCGESPEITILLSNEQEDIPKGTPLIYETKELGGTQSVQAGEVRKCTTEGGATNLLARLNSKYGHYIRKDTRFEVRSNKETGKVELVAITTGRDSPPAEEGDVLRETRGQVIDFGERQVRNPRGMIVKVALGIGVLFLLFFLFRLTRAFGTTIFAVIAGAAAAKYLTPYLEETAERLVPLEYRPDLVAYGAAFLIGFIVGKILFGMIFRRVRRRY